MAGAGSVQVKVLNLLTGGNVQKAINNDLQIMIRPMLCFASHTILSALMFCRLTKYLGATWIVFVFIN